MERRGAVGRKEEEGNRAEGNGRAGERTDKPHKYKSWSQA